MLVGLSVAIMQVTVSVAIMQLEFSAAKMLVTIFIVIMHVGVSVAIMQVVFSARHYAHDCLTVSIVIMQVTVSVVAMQVAVSSKNFIHFLNWHPFFIKLTRKHLKTLYQVYISPIVNILPKLETLRVEIICKLVKRVIQYYCFPNESMKGGDILDLQKGG